MNTKVFFFYPVTMKISMIEYHHLINCQTYGLFEHSSLWGEISKMNLVTCIL